MRYLTSKANAYLTSKANAMEGKERSLKAVYTGLRVKGGVGGRRRVSAATRTVAIQTMSATQRWIICNQTGAWRVMLSMPRKSWETTAIPTIPANLTGAWVFAAGARDEDRDHNGGQNGERGMKHAQAQEEVATGRKIFRHGGVREESIAEGGDDSGGGGDKQHGECRMRQARNPFSSSARFVDRR